MNHALSLVEILIALVCLSILITYGVGNFMTSAVQIDGMSKFDKGVIYAVDAIETCKSWPFTKLDKDDAENTADEKYYLEYVYNKDDSIFDPDSETPENLAQFWHITYFDDYTYRRTVTIDNLDSNNTDIEVKLKFVTVKVRWWPRRYEDEEAAAAGGYTVPEYEINTVIGK